MTVIAIEEHWVDPRLNAALDMLTDERRDESLALNAIGDNFELLTDLGDARLRMMDAQGVDLQILSLAPPGVGAICPTDARRFSRDANDLAAAAVTRHPDRFRMLATLPMTDPVGAVEELERAVRAGAVGAMVYGRTGDVPLDDPRFDDLLAMATSLRVPLFIHPQIPSQPLRLAAYSGFEPIVDLALATFSWGWHIEAATAALRLIARGAFDRHPDLQIVLGHWGELLMFWHERIAGLSRLAHLDRPVHEVLRHNVHLTASGMLDPALLRHSLAVTTIDRILFSTDFPFQRPRLDDIAALLSEFDSDEDRERFMSGNAMKLFRIDGVASGSEGDRS